MPIHSLQNTPLPTLVDCLLQSFEGYFVQLPSSVEYWEERYRAARVDWALSFGMFEEGKLVGFIVNGVDDFGGLKTAFNTGTGVVPRHRGRAFVDQLYAHALPILKAHRIQQCALEVICQNERAIRVYGRIGFTKSRRVHCFKGEIHSSNADIQIHEVNIALLLEMDSPDRTWDSWDNCNNAIRNGAEVYRAYEVQQDNRTIGWFVVNPKSGYVPRCVVIHAADTSDWKLVFEGIGRVCATVRMNNLDERCHETLAGLRAVGMINHIDQFEMVMPIL